MSPTDTSHMSDDERKAWSRERSKAHRRRDPDRARAYLRGWNARNKDKTVVYRKTWAERKGPGARAVLLASVARSRGKKAGLAHDLTTARVERALRAGVCEVTGLPFNMGKRDKTWDTPSIDRKIPSLGYTDDNIQMVLLCVNQMFGTWGREKAVVVAKALIAAEATDGVE